MLGFTQATGKLVTYWAQVNSQITSLLKILKDMFEMLSNALVIKKTTKI